MFRPMTVAVRAKEERRKMGEGVMEKTYIILDKECVAKTYHVENVKKAICEYAEYCGLLIALTTFEKAIQNLVLSEIIELFNQNCLVYEDKIEKIFTGYVPLFDENKQECEYMEDEIYPLTILEDRYTGIYSGGKYTAWNLEFYEIPRDIVLSDEPCMEFWNDEEKEQKYIVGKGETVSEALADLYIKLKGISND